MGEVVLEEGAVAWLQSEDAPAWPVVLQMRRQAYWRVKLLGEHGRQVEEVLARPTHLSDFASCIHHAAADDAKVRLRVVRAAHDAIEHVRQGGVAAQREKMDVDALLRLLSFMVPAGALHQHSGGGGGGSGDTVAPTAAPPKVHTDKEHLAHRAHLERCQREVQTWHANVGKRREVREGAKRDYEYARAAVREAEEALNNAQRRAVNAETRLAACESDVKEGLVELRSRKVALRAAQSLIREGAGASIPNDDPVAVPNGGNVKRAAATKEENGTPKRQCVEEEVIDEGNAARSASASLPVPPPPITSAATAAAPAAAAVAAPGTQVVCAAIESARVSTSEDSVSTATVGSPEYVPPVSVASTTSSTPPTVVPRPTTAATRGPTSASATAREQPPPKSYAGAVRTGAGAGAGAGAVPAGAGAVTRRPSLPKTMDGTPLQRRGKKLEISGALPPLYRRALDALGHRRLVATTAVATAAGAGAPSNSAGAGGVMAPKTRMDVFREDLRAYQMSRGHDVYLPNFGGTRVDMYKLVRAFLSVGGLEAAIRMRALSFVLREADVEFSNSYYTHRLKTFYAHFVHPYEHHLVHGTPVSHENALRIINESARQKKNVK